MKMYVYKQLPVQRGQRESRAIGQKLSRDDNERLRPTIKVYFSWTLAMMPCGHPSTALSLLIHPIQWTFAK